MSMHPKDMMFTSESVAEGHPDKLCDQISDAVVDECLRLDPASRVACNTYVTMGLILIGGEVTTTALFNLEQVVRKLGNEIGCSSPRPRRPKHGPEKWKPVFGKDHAPTIGESAMTISKKGGHAFRRGATRPPQAKEHPWTPGLI